MKFPRIITLVFTALLAVSWSPNTTSRSNFWAAPPDGSPGCDTCHGSTTGCASCHAHGVHPDKNKDTLNVVATTDKPTYTVGETIIVSITGSYKLGWVRTKLWDKDCSVVGCLTDGAVVVNSNNCPSCPVGVGGVDGVTNEFPGPVTMSYAAPLTPGTYTWSASHYGNHIDLDQVGSGPTVFGSLYLYDPDVGGNQTGTPHGDEIVTFTFDVIAGANNIPVAVNDAVATPVNTPIDIDVLLNDTDADVADTLTVNTFDSTSTSGAVVSCNVSFIKGTPQCFFTPVTNLCNTDTFTYDVTDGTDVSVSSATVSIQVGDANAPIITAPSDLTITLPAGSPGPVLATDPEIVAFLASASSSDGEEGGLAVGNNAPGSFSIGTTPVTFTSTDSCGNAATSVFANVIIDVAPNNPPVVTAPAPASTTAGLCVISLPDTDSAIAAFLSGATATDAEDGDLTGAITHDAPANFSIGSTLVTFTVIDSLSSVATDSATFTVNETPNTAPTVIAPTPISIDIPEGTAPVPASDPAIVAFLAAASAIDTEDGTLTVSNDAPVNFPLGITTVTFTTTDACGLVDTSTADVTIQEIGGNTPPVLNTPTPITVVAGLCATTISATDAAITAFLSGATSSDVEDGDLTAFITQDAPADFPVSLSPGTITTVTFSITDSGNPNATPLTTTAAVNVTAVDPNTASGLTVPTPLNMSVLAGTTQVADSDPEIAAFLATASATDAEDGSLTVTHDAPANFPLGTTIVTFSVTDSCGLVTTLTASVTITELANNAPGVTAPAPVSVTAGLCVASLPDTEPAISAFLSGATAIDVEDGDLSGSITHDAPANFPIGPTVVTFTAIDSLLASGSGGSTLTVNETLNTAPIVTASTPITIIVDQGTTFVAASDPAIVAFLAEASASDTEDGVLSVSHDAPANFPQGTTIVTFTATDACGLVTTSTATVTIQETAPNTAPVMTMPDPITLTAGLCASSVSGANNSIEKFIRDARASDAEDGNLRWYITNNAPRDFFLGDTVVTFTVTDSGDPSGIPITTTDTSVVTVNATPNSSAVVSAPAPITVTVAAGATPVLATHPSIAAFLASASATDAEDGSLTVSHDAPASFPLGITVVTFIATDDCGLVATATASVTIEEGAVPNTAPLLTAPAPISVAAGLCASSLSASDSSIVSFLSSATSNDAEDGPLSVGNDAPLNFLLGDTLVTFTVTDSGDPTATPMTTTDTSTVSVFDPNMFPVVNAPAPLTIIVTIGTTSVAVSDPAIVAFLAAASGSDAEDGALSVSNDAPANFPLGSTIVTFTATDACGLITTATATVTIEEEAVPNTAPVLTTPTPITVTAGLCTSSVSGTNNNIEKFIRDARATDTEDGNLRWYITSNALRDFILGDTVVTFSVTDSGNPSGIPITTTDTSVVTVNETLNTVPAVTAPAPITVTVTFGATPVAVSHAEIAAFLAAASATDAEDGALSVSHDAPASFPLGSTVVTFTATDGCGLVATATATVTIQEGVVPNTAPTLTAPAPISVAAGLCAASLSAGDSAITAFLNGATANDAEDGPLVAGNDAPLDFLLGDTLVTFSVTDSGDPTATPMTTTDTSTVSVFDPNTFPVVNAPAPLTLIVTIGTTSVADSDPAIAAFLAAASGSDAEDGALSVSNDAPASFPLGSTIVTFTTTDACGLITTATATVTIEEEPVPNTAPVLTAPAPISVTAGLCASSIMALHPVIDTFLSSATASDAEDGNLRWYVTYNAPRDFFLGDTVVTFTVTDSGDPSGIPLTTTDTSTVTVNEMPNSAPVVTAPAPISVTVAVGTSPVAATHPEIAAFLVSASATDAEDGSLSVTHDAPADFPLGSTIVTFTATDACGLVTTATATVTIVEQ